MAMEGGWSPEPAPALKDTAPNTGTPLAAVPPLSHQRGPAGRLRGLPAETRPARPCPGVLPRAGQGLCVQHLRGTPDPVQLSRGLTESLRV